MLGLAQAPPHPGFHRVDPSSIDGTPTVKIAVLAHIRYPVAQPFRGGMEAHCHALCEGLRRAGHEVVLFAAAGSDDPQLVAICDAPYEQVLPWEVHRGSVALADYQRQGFECAWEAITRGDFDIVHNNSLFPEVIGWAAAAGVPCVTSQHVPPFGMMRDAVTAVAWAGHALFTVTSRHQLTLWDHAACPNLRVVGNGVDTQFWRPAEDVGEYFTWSGRIVPNKGLAQAIAAAKLAKVRLRIFGPVEDVAYFTDSIEPGLGDGIEYHGFKRSEGLRDMLARSRAAVVTPMWDEPFGLVAAEALACGVPVLAFDRGALRDVVGECGIVVPPADIAALAQAFRDHARIPRDGCRARALAELSIEAMIAGYEACYADASAAARAPGSHAAARSSSHARTAALLA